MKITLSTAMRARDVSRPRAEQLARAAEREYDIVVIDSPPVLPVTDVQSVAGYADAILLLARSGVTTRVSLQRSYNMLLPHAKPHWPSSSIWSRFRTRFS